MSRIKHSIIAVMAGVLLAGSTVLAGNDLAGEFVNPPKEAQPWVYYMVLNGNLTKEGITADLEAMARVGIGGLLYMEVDQGAPKGQADFLGPLWMELFKHACKEAKRLGLEINMNNDAGWCGSGGPWITPELSMQKVVWSEAVVDGGTNWTINLPEPKSVTNYYRDIAILAMPAVAETNRIAGIKFKAAFAMKQKDVAPAPADYEKAAADSIIESGKIVDLTGRKEWSVPAGKWLVMRFGHTTTGKDNHPAPESGRGLECDKLSREAAAAAFEGLIGKLIDVNRELSGQGKTLVSTHIDSWEVGSQNWTRKMREEFQRRRGYDMLKYMPVYSGRVVESMETSERFLWDLRQTISDMLVENYAGEFRRQANKHGLRLSIEAYGEPADDLKYAGEADEPMSEFWAWGKYVAADHCFRMSSAAHVYGKRILGAEAFTADNKEKWQGHPAGIKDLGDWAFCEGINRFVFHRYAAQPWVNPDYAPGMSMGPWGLHYERTQTWWEQSKPWHEYLARCQYMLRQGLFVADVLLLQPEGAPRHYASPNGMEINPHIRGGYNYDACGMDALVERVSVKDGRLVLPDGMSYRVLALPEVETMTPRLIRKISEIAEQGATIIGWNKAPVKSPSLADMGAGDEEVRKMGEKLWKSGKVLAREKVDGNAIYEILGGLGVKPDFKADPVLRYIHRVDGDTDIYFVANPEQKHVDAVASFRVAGKTPEFWWPDTGRMGPALAYEEKDGITSLPVHMEPSGSVFVIFRNKVGERSQIVSVKRDGVEMLGQHGTNTVSALPALDIARDEMWQSGSYVVKTADGKTGEINIKIPEALEITGAWEVRFDPKRGGPEKVTFENLQDWAKRPEDGIKHFSGMATYRKMFDFPVIAGKQELQQAHRVWLDLGRVAVMAEVKLNGKDLGVLWKPPYRVDITDALKQGWNTLEVKVVNLWINRQIGDEELPEDSDRKKIGTIKSWPQWVNEGKPSPTGRYAFTSWRLWKKGEPLVESGLLGPVILRYSGKVK